MHGHLNVKQIMCCLLRNFRNLSYPKSSLSTGSSRTVDWYTDNSHPSGLQGQGIRAKEKDNDLEYPQTPVIITCDVLSAVCFKLRQQSRYRPGVAQRVPGS